MIKPLIWKEWQEQRWKMFFGTLMLAFFTGSLLAARLTTDRELIIVVWVLGGLILSLYSAMGVFAPEITNGTKTFVLSKPIQSWQIFFGKWFCGWLNFAVPMLICSLALATIVLLHPEGRLFEIKYIARGTFAGISLGTMFYSMTGCFAPRKASEAVVGFTGCIILFVFILHVLITQITTIGTSWATGFSIPQELFLFINPLIWVNLMRPIHAEMHQSLLIIEQAIIFIVTILIGLRKWRRSL